MKRETPSRQDEIKLTTPKESGHTFASQESPGMCAIRPMKKGYLLRPNLLEEERQRNGGKQADRNRGGAQEVQRDRKKVEATR